MTSAPPLVDYQAPLEIAAKSMIRFKKPERLIKMIVRMIHDQIDTSHAAVLLYVKDKHYYKLIESKGSRGSKIPIGYARVEPGCPLIQVFTEKRNAFRRATKDGILIYKELDALAHRDITPLIPDIKRQMEILGAEICIPSYFKRQLLGILVLGEKRSARSFSKRDLGMLVTLANDAAMAISNAQLIERLQHKVEEVQELYSREHKLFVHTSIALATAIDAKDRYTHGHTERVTRYCLEIYNEMNAKECSEEALHIAALLHDIGKIGVPDIVLNKKGRLARQERAKMEEHPTIGASILMPIRELGGVIEGVRHHHEHFDGSGYPDHLKGDQIPYISRIIAVADTFDAITTDRPYRKKKDVEAAITELSKYSGTQFDPEVVKAFLLAYQKGNIIV